jgi:hypothetical protein
LCLAGYTRGLLNDLRLPEKSRVHAFGEFATRGMAVSALRPGASGSCSSADGGPQASSAERWAHYFRLAYMSCSVEMLGVQIRVLLALASPAVQAAIVAGLALAGITLAGRFLK